MYNWSYVWKLFYKCCIRPKMFRKFKLELTEDSPHPRLVPTVLEDALQSSRERHHRWHCPEMTTECHDTDLPDRVLSAALKRCEGYGVNKPVSDLVWGLFHKRQFMPGVTNGSGGHRPDGTACHCFAERTCCQAALRSTNLYPSISAFLSLLSIAVMGQWPKATWE